MDLSDLRARLAKYGQEHLLRFWDELDEKISEEEKGKGESDRTKNEKERFYEELMSINYENVSKYFRSCKKEMEREEQLDDELQPLPQEIIGSFAHTDSSLIKEYEQEGLRKISEGKVAVLLLAGGQGTRLGVTYPKGMYDVGLPSHRTLYQIQAERIIKIQRLAEKLTGKISKVTWYIMTSEHTQDATFQFFERNKFFGLSPHDVIFFEQNTLPCMTFEGKVILESPFKVATAPDGNGGLYKAVEDNKILEDMERRGVEYIHIYCVDNILVKMVDPVFIGYCLKSGANCATKVVAKREPSEPVGVVCRLRGRYQVVEYSEISRDASEKCDVTSGRLVYNSGTIAIHFLTRDFLTYIVREKEGELKHHVAKKKIPYYDEGTGSTVKPSVNNGIKMEKFVFDIFPFSDNFAVWEVEREREFSPLKNSNDAPQDNPTTSRKSLLDLHGRWVLDAGGKFILNSTTENSCVSSESHEISKKTSVDLITAQCEISPLLSFAGEGLENIVKGKLFAPLALLEDTTPSQVLS